MSAELRFVGVALDCADPVELSQFYQRLLGATVLWASDDSVGLRLPGSGVVLQLIRVDDYRPPTWPDSTVPKQMHLDLTAGVELDGPEAWAVELGANREGGHLGYGVLPAHRRLGYATEILRQAVIVARAVGVTRVLVTCDDDNVASARTIERCGGVLEDVVSTADVPATRRYRIDLTSTGLARQPTPPCAAMP